MKALIVEDSDLIRFRLVRQIGVLPGIDRVMAAPGCTVAQHLVASLRGAPLVMVLDLHLPDGDPVALIPQFKREHQELKIAVLTNDATPYNRERCLQAGADWFFDKSTEFEDLLTQLQALSSPPRLRRFL
jgi:two-component system OmpR family response regulator